jgi:hypothetical protein
VFSLRPTRIGWEELSAFEKRRIYRKLHIRLGVVTGVEMHQGGETKFILSQ